LREMLGGPVAAAAAAACLTLWCSVGEGQGGSPQRPASAPRWVQAMGLGSLQTREVTKIAQGSR
jgi:hypothetical protein